MSATPANPTPEPVHVLRYGTSTSGKAQTLNALIREALAAA